MASTHVATPMNTSRIWSFVGTLYVATPLWPSVGVKPNTPKVGDLESSRTPECLEFNSKAQTPHIEVFLVSLKRS